METNPTFLEFVVAIVALPLQLYKEFVFSILDFVAFQIFNLPQ